MSIAFGITFIVHVDLLVRVGMRVVAARELDGLRGEQRRRGRVRNQRLERAALQSWVLFERALESALLGQSLQRACVELRVVRESLQGVGLLM